jgi:hypothetical protein
VTGSPPLAFALHQPYWRSAGIARSIQARLVRVAAEASYFEIQVSTVSQLGQDVGLIRATFAIPASLAAWRELECR